MRAELNEHGMALALSNTYSTVPLHLSLHEPRGTYFWRALALPSKVKCCAKDTAIFL